MVMVMVRADSDYNHHHHGGDADFDDKSITFAIQYILVPQAFIFSALQWRRDVGVERWAGGGLHSVPVIRIMLKPSSLSSE